MVRKAFSSKLIKDLERKHTDECQTRNSREVICEEGFLKGEDARKKRSKKARRLHY